MTSRIVILGRSTGGTLAANRLRRRYRPEDAVAGGVTAASRPSPSFVEMIPDTGAGMYARKASVDLFGLEKNAFIPQVQDIITVGEFYEIAAGGHTIFT